MQQSEEKVPAQGEILCHYLKDFIPKERTNRIRCHPYSELMVIRQGDVIYTASGQTRRLEGGCVIYNRMGSIHNQFVQSTRLYERYKLTFYADDLLPDGDAGKLLFQPLSASFAKELSEEDFHAIYTLCRDVSKTARNEFLSPLDRLRIKGDLLLALLHADHAEERQTGKEESYIPSVVKYVNAHLCEKLCLSRIAAEFFVSKSKLAYDFRAYCNMSIHEYVTMERVEHAKALLEKGMTVAAVAEALAFSTASYFIKVFASVTGTTPLQYQLSRTHLPY